MTNQTSYKVASLFSGCGGLDLGFSGGFEIFGRLYDKHPFEIVWANDIFKEACQTYAHNIGNHIHEGDISQFDKEQIPKTDIVIGGFPCQDFSTAGKRQGITVKRGRLYLEMIDVIRHVKPKIFIAENVEGLVNMENGLILETIKSDMSRIESETGEVVEYEVQHRLLHAADYGVPQFRKRVFIVGVRKDLGVSYEYPTPTHEGNWMTAKEAIDDLWGKEADTAIHNHQQVSRAKFYPGKKMQGNLQIKADQPSFTIRAEHHGNIEAHYRSTNEEEPDNMQHWRRLTVRECARIQTFPDYYELKGSGSMAYKQVGNAVPPVLGWHMAKSIADVLQKINKKDLVASTDR